MLFSCRSPHVASKPESAELHAIKNNYASVEGNEEVWIRGSKMIGNREFLNQLGSQCVTISASLQLPCILRYVAGLVKLNVILEQL